MDQQGICPILASSAPNPSSRIRHYGYGACIDIDPLNSINPGLDINPLGQDEICYWRHETPGQTPAVDL